MVEQSIHEPKFEGSNHVATGARKEKIGKIIFSNFSSFYTGDYLLHNLLITGVQVSLELFFYRQDTQTTTLSMMTLRITIKMGH
jgi:hypothetical protein